MDQRERKVLEHYRKQELMIAHNLNLVNHPDFVNLDGRLTMAKSLVEQDRALHNEMTMLFAPHPTSEALSPLTIGAYCSTLLEDCRAICQMATQRAPVWTYDRIAAFIQDMEQLLPFANTTFKQNFVLVLKIISDAQSRSDVAALADLFYGEVPALIRSLQSVYRKFDVSEHSSSKPNSSVPTNSAQV